MNDKHRFHIADYVVFGLTICVSLAIGIFFAIRRRNVASNSEYLMGGRQMRLLPITVSIIVSFVSTVGVLGLPAEMFLYGTEAIWILIGTAVGNMISAVIFVPLYYRLKPTSTIEYHTLRFNSRTLEAVMCLLYMVTLVLYAGVLVFSPAIAFEAVSGCPVWISILIGGLSTTIYTTIGGIRAVVWTDVFQAMLYFSGLIATVTLGIHKTGGLQQVWSMNEKWGHIHFVDFTFDPTARLTFWNAGVANVIYHLAVATHQMYVQRYCALPTFKKAMWSMVLMIPGYMISASLSLFAGVIAFGYYAKKGCDPIRSGTLRNPNQIFPYFVMDVMNYPPLPGMFVACVFSAALSSLSSTLNGVTAVTWQHILRYKYGHLKESKQARISKLVTLFAGILSIGVAFMVNEVGGTLFKVHFIFIGSAMGPVFGSVILGAVWPKAGPKGTILGALLGFAFCMWIGLGGSFYKVGQPPLPGPTQQCSSMINCTNALDAMANNTGTECIGNTLVGMKAQFSNKTENVHTVNGSSILYSLYATSYFYHLPMGAAIVIVVGFITSFIPGFDQGEPVQRKTVLGFVAKCFPTLVATSYDMQPKGDEGAVPLQPVVALQSNDHKTHGEI